MGAKAGCPDWNLAGQSLCATSSGLVSVAKYAIPRIAISVDKLGTRVYAASASNASVPRQTREGY